MLCRFTALLFACSLFTSGCSVVPNAHASPEPPSESNLGCIVLPSATNIVQIRLYTNAAPSAPFLVNTFDLLAYGETLLRAPGGKPLQRWLAGGPTNHASLHSVLLDGRGPVLGPTNSLSVLREASGPSWKYVAVDATPAYSDRAERYQRAILFVEPDLFVLHDHIVTWNPASFEMFLRTPDAARVDDVWHDLRLGLSRAGFRIQSPGEKRAPRSWERVSKVEDPILPGTAAMRLGPTNQLSQLDLITVIATYPAGSKRDYAFKLLESTSAVGARIHRDGWPTLVAFKTSTNEADASLTGFGFKGPVGVDVFRPKRK